MLAGGALGVAEATDSLTLSLVAEMTSPVFSRAPGSAP